MTPTEAPATEPPSRHRWKRKV
ncbi:hypothetical protein AT1G72755 [Arabidopsis thaliana]|uniref:Uncharacterized protein n=1 Tax=Arabidopsis thaliana TaxID=3702 RepID=A0A1P8AQ41_ARATH|nr:uncharacterized protein AT1G72755 [Arabidopsis thaliana]ANM58783.1 hypothetical protein AT1G72755 [Arabidopsis thaliana]|eukprot:NP_001336507.1 hypothetical protein AT1G72755 [Arabidopsis thaliana]